MSLPTDNLERNILRIFFDTVSSISPIDNTISDSKIVRDTQAKLRNALRGAEQRCTCAKRSWGGPCEVCQASDRELYTLRNFFREIRKAKKRNMTTQNLAEFVENTGRETNSLARRS